MWTFICSGEFFIERKLLQQFIVKIVTIFTAANQLRHTPSAPVATLPQASTATSNRRAQRSCTRTKVTLQLVWTTTWRSFVWALSSPTTITCNLSVWRNRSQRAAPKRGWQAGVAWRPVAAMVNWSRLCCQLLAEALALAPRTGVLVSLKAWFVLAMRTVPKELATATLVALWLSRTATGLFYHFISFFNFCGTQ